MQQPQQHGTRAALAEKRSAYTELDRTIRTFEGLRIPAPKGYYRQRAELHREIVRLGRTLAEETARDAAPDSTDAAA